MIQIQSLLCLLIGLTLSALAVEVTVLPDADAGTVDVTEETISDSTEAHTQIPGLGLNVTSQYGSSTEALPEVISTTQGLDNTTYTVLIEDAPGGLEWGTLVGVIAGIVSLIGVSIMIIILIVRKMGRYSRP